ncbi:MAG: Holliday junction branch migration protein RuvA [Patescibacteria group bacterium]
MIAQLRGKISFRGDKFIILDVNGIGYKVFVTPEILKKSRGKTEFLVWTHLHVREDILDLYGFLEHSELKLFEMLISVSGIGPKSALGIIGVAPIDTLKRAISAGETNYLTKVSGIGKRNAEKIIIELREKLGGDEFLEGRDELLKDEQDVLAALESLGYSLRDAREALKNVPPEITGAQNRIKHALKQLGK